MNEIHRLISNFIIFDHMFSLISLVIKVIDCSLSLAATIERDVNETTIWSVHSTGSSQVKISKKLFKLIIDFLRLGGKGGKERIWGGIDIRRLELNAVLWCDDRWIDNTYVEGMKLSSSKVSSNSRYL